MFTFCSYSINITGNSWQRRKTSVRRETLTPFIEKKQELTAKKIILTAQNFNQELMRDTCDSFSSFLSENKSVYYSKLLDNEPNPVYYVRACKRSQSVIVLKAGSSFRSCECTHKRSCIYSGRLAVKCIHSHTHTQTQRHTHTQISALISILKQNSTRLPFSTCQSAFVSVIDS